ncbi:MAG: hypothetical protein KME26_18115 [Oscillatoria princeps RMCB-10]|jgi:hypothetical protein|nr:hypothetical protein [Oscillatoria princeps RMCB-10]
MYFNFAGFTAGLVILLLLAFGILQWVHIPAGSFLDWVIGGVSFWWLLIIVTVPWNIHFKAKEVLAEADQSAEKGIPVDAKQIKYVKLLAKRALLAAIALHLLSAAGLYALAITGISGVGYVSSGAALLLTLLRPAVRGYEYLAARLAMIGERVKYPREDVLELRDRVAGLESAVKNLQEQLDPSNESSWASSQHRQLEGTRNDLTRIAASLEQLRAANQAEHDRLGREAQNAIAQLNADSQFLDRVREIIRFFKEA